MTQTQSIVLGRSFRGPIGTEIDDLLPCTYPTSPQAEFQLGLVRVLQDTVQAQGDVRRGGVTDALKRGHTFRKDRSVFSH